MTEEQTSPSPPSQIPTAQRRYARLTGWLYLLLGITGFFTRTLWHMFTLSGHLMALHIAIGICGLTVSRQGGQRAHRLYSVGLGLGLTVWGVAGTVAPQVLQPSPLPLENALHV
ncbi:MAG: DUF4383 domain-containing protein, partial [Firmicutes bacterium]|nr:DUF4383 domain-containing protein [Bacillota bacterium]